MIAPITAPKMNLRNCASSLLIVTVLACTSKEPRTAEDSAAAAEAMVDSAMKSGREALTPPGESASAAVTLPPQGTEPAADEWQVTPRGIGSLKAGMSLDEANVILHGDLDVPANPGECTVVKKKGDPKGIAVMVENGIVTRVNVTGPSVTTVEGAKIGDTEERVKSLYPGQVTVQPHKYTTGHYLVVTPPNAGEHRIIFETEGGKVTRFRSGKMPSVGYVEGCS